MDKIAILANSVKSFLEKDSTGHDFDHAQRVYNLAMKIMQTEGGNKIIISAAALVHDIMRPWEKQTGKSHFGLEALSKIRIVLEESKFDAEEIKKILHVVELHDIYDWSEKISDKSIELQIVQDADNLDAIGALGIARTFAFGGAHGRRFWDPEESLEFEHDFVDQKPQTLTTVGHFYEKLLKLKANMNTKTGKELAEKRHEFMKQFLEQFFAEWEGKR